MSAWIVARAHIDVLVLASVQFAVPYDDSDSASRAPGRSALAAAGAELWAENHRSVEHRYDQHTPPPTYAPPIAEVVLDPVAVVKAIDCYVYQSSEHPNWAGSRADRSCRRLRAAAMTRLAVEAPTDSSDLAHPAGWDQAPWASTISLKR